MTSLQTDILKHTDSARLPQIDVLRGVAAFGVFLFHVAMAVGFDKRVLPPLDIFGKTWTNIPSVFSLGATGVSLFFVISGFCLALKPLRLKLRSVGYLKYLHGRFGRVYPAYFVAVLFSLFVGFLLGRDFALREGLSYFVFLQGFIQQWHFSVNGALWSMSTEVQFYLTFPFIFMAFSRLPARALLACAFTATMIFRGYCVLMPSGGEVIGGINTATFLMNSLPGRLFEFVLGMFLASEWIKDRTAVVNFCRILVVPASIFGMFARMKLATWIAEPALGVMCATVVGTMLGNRYFSIAGFLSFFGRLSYSFFLLHVPVVLFVEECVRRNLELSLYGKFIVVGLTSCAVTLFLSTLLYHYVEERFFHLIKRRGITPKGFSGSAV